MKTKTINGITYTHRTRDGKPARIVCDNVAGTQYPVIVLYLSNGKEVQGRYTKRLTYTVCENTHGLDLLEGVEEEINWVEVPIDTPVWCRMGGWRLEA